MTESPPGLYVMNATGDLTPVATEDGGGDRDLLREALLELDVPPTEITPVQKDETDTAEFDAQLACLTFNALERCACVAASSDEMDVACEYAETLFFVSDQMPAFYGVFIEESAEYGMAGGEAYEANVGHQMMRIRDYARENDHTVRDWFDRAEGNLEVDQ
jgi:hypothetical protein